MFFLILRPDLWQTYSKITFLAMNHIFLYLKEKNDCAVF
jgi:hypothetical protein